MDCLPQMVTNLSIKIELTKEWREKGFFTWWFQWSENFWTFVRHLRKTFIQVFKSWGSLFQMLLLCRHFHDLFTFGKNVILLLGIVYPLGVVLLFNRMLTKSSSVS